MESIERESCIETISNLNFKNHVLQSRKPVLLLCMSSRQMLPEQVDALRQHIADNYDGDISICALEEDFMHAFKQMYGVNGSPVFILFQKGKEIGRMLGIADPGHLSAFLTRYLPEAGDNPLEVVAWQ